MAVKLISFFDFDYLVPLGYNNQENCKIAGKNFKIKYHVTHCRGRTDGSNEFIVWYTYVNSACIWMHGTW